MLVPYAMRIALALGRGLPQGPLGFFGEARLPMRVWPTDVDFYLHANNGSYLTLMDAGRYQLALRTGLARVMLKRNCWPVLGGAIVRFRRELRLLERFELCSRLLGWRGKWFFIEQRFENDGVVHASAIHKAVMRRKGRSVPFEEIARACGCSVTSPPLPHLAAWQEVLASKERLAGHSPDEEAG
ncbi:MAG: thioesterase family protein [Deltaproteobacteria bacterium]|nr:thioesterase family protein [Deltaproteobacteria bacterium]